MVAIYSIGCLLLACSKLTGIGDDREKRVKMIKCNLTGKQMAFILLNRRLQVVVGAFCKFPSDKCRSKFTNLTN